VPEVRRLLDALVVLARGGNFDTSVFAAKVGDREGLDGYADRRQQACEPATLVGAARRVAR